MADYHIYIHSDSPDSSPSAKFKPQAVRESDDESTGATSSNSPFKTALKKGYNFVQSGGNVISPIAQKVGSAIPQVALVLAVLKVADQVVSAGFEHVSEYTGHYAHSLGYNNIKNALSWGLNPIGQSIKLAKRQTQRNKHNLQIQEQNLLIGNSTYKNTTKGV